MSTVVIGRVRKPHGVRGAVKVESYSGEAGHFRALETVELVRDGRVRPMEIISVAVHNGVPVVQFRGIDTPEIARTISGWEIRVDREQAAKLDTNEYYAADLVGSIVVVDGEQAGRVRAVVDGSQAPLLEVELSDGRSPVLIPFMDRFVGDVDTVAGRIEINERWILDIE
ncbi:MAG: ribosome maturation factor RimM [Spirochaeta sp.]|nr:ribosome maturation factor RimM [Spirochaeta sp.]